MPHICPLLDKMRGFFYKNKLFHVKLFNKYILYMGISVDFLPIERFSLDKKISRAIVSEPIGAFVVFFRGAYGTPGALEKSPIEGCFALDNGADTCSTNICSIFWSCVISMFFPLSPLTYPLYHARGRGGNAQTSGYVKCQKQISTTFSQIKKVNLG